MSSTTTFASLSASDYENLPFVAEGESKVVRYFGGGKAALKLKPTVYSYSRNRYGLVPGTEHLRLKMTEILVRELTRAGIAHAFRGFGDDWILSDLILERTLDGFLYVPDDVDLDTLPIGSPLEVIVKKSHVGTPKHRYYRMQECPFRKGIRGSIEDEKPYPEIMVRFDWRNPLQDAKGNRLADEVLPDSMANWFIDVEVASRTALDAFNILGEFLYNKGINLIDVCFFITEDGQTIYSEISQDCGRFVHRGEHFDKEIWRAGGSNQLVKEKWKAILNMIA